MTGWIQCDLESESDSENRAPHPFQISLPEAAMFLRVLKFLTTIWLTTSLLGGCLRNDPPGPPTGLTVKAGESSAVVTWAVDPEVEYWLFYAPKSVAPTTTDMSKGWTDLAGGSVVIRVQSPATVINLTNDTEYVFTVNGRVSGGPGGKGATLNYATPRAGGGEWTSSQSGSQELRAATYGGVYVAAGLRGALVTSLDGIKYETVNSTTDSNLHSATFLGGYKLVGDGGTILVSSDAKDWKALGSETTKTDRDLYGIGNNGLATTVAVGASGTIVVSTDGATWKSADSKTSNHLYGVAYSSLKGGLWIAVGAGGVMLKSQDAFDWTPIDLGTTADLRGVDLRGVSYALLPLATGQSTATSVFVAVGSGGTILTSADGSIWTRSTDPINSQTGTPVNLSTVNWNAITYGKQFVVVGSGGNILTSKDGNTFTASAQTGTTEDLHAVARGYLGYSAAGAGGTVLLSK